ncbi:hypothetical protein DES49_0001 [Halospina denitrificans]|uniref:Uncharacterized protein n=1 Tax=Halospina denitrificans TaxID=332522 RepID=A0A4R7JZD4_9GAMM|nr:hypothetical protein [Halospina denitrificans]TDT43902.1 hypothetical protein DES49_0001 [Halospina denitrificans]
MEDLACTWTPQVIVEIINALAWPVVVLLIALRFRSSIADSVRNFLSRNSVSEVSATTTGISAKFVAAKQSSETKESMGTSSAALPESMTIEAIRDRHSKAVTELSEEIYEGVLTHLQALDLSSEEEREILAKEISLLQSAIQFSDINKVLFRSQFNLFSIMSENNNYISREGLQKHFDEIKKFVGDGFEGWDWVKYVSYPVSTGLLVDECGGYTLSKLGRSYLNFMSRNPQLIDDLAKL